MDHRKYLQNTIIQLGLALGIIRVGIALLAGNFMSPEEISQSVLLTGAVMAVALVTMIYGGFQVRKNQGDRLQFWDGFLLCMGIFTISSIIAALYNGWYVTQLPKEVLAASPGLGNRATVSAQFEGLITNLIVGGIISFLLALGLKRTHPRAEV